MMVGALDNHSPERQVGRKDSRRGGNLRKKLWRGTVLMLPRAGALAIVVLGVTGVFAASGPVVIDPSRGVIDGIAGAAFWPSVDGATPSDPSGFWVHLVPESDLGSEIVRPCGEWFLLAPEPTAYAWWVEGPGLISSRTLVMHYARVPASERAARAAVAPVGPAGTVAVKNPPNLIKRWSIRLLSADGLFARRGGAAAAIAGVAMPAGPTVAALYDDEAAEYVALGVPFTLSAGERHVVELLPPSGPTTDLIALVKRPARLGVGSKDDVSATLLTPEGVLTPALVVRQPERVYFLWYGVKAKRGTLEVRSERLFAAPGEVRLHNGRVEYRLIELRTLPNLHVRLIIPDELASETAVIALLRVAGDKPVTQVSLKPGVAAADIEAVPADVLRVVVSLGSWKFDETVDLSTGQDQEVTIEPRLIRVRGVVRVGDHPVAATVRFRFAPDEAWVVGHAGEDGRYAVVLAKAGFYTVCVDLAGRADPFWVVPGPRIGGDRELDLTLPDNEIRVEVHDAATGQAVADAKVEVSSSSKVGSISSSVRYTTDSAGKATLPPVRAGTLALTVAAAGYDTKEVAAEPVPEGHHERSIKVDLDPWRARATVVVTGPDGSPAAGAGLWLTVGIPVPPSFVGSCDATGHGEIPSRPGYLLVVRHQNAGFAIVPTAEPVEGVPIQVRLPRAAPALVLRVRNPDGTPSRSARVLIRAGGAWIPDPLLRWITGSPAAATYDGYWTGVCLPAAPVAALAWPSAKQALGEALAGLMDDRRTEVLFPWPNVVDVTAW
jgi:hypothetical protein